MSERMAFNDGVDKGYSRALDRIAELKAENAALKREVQLVCDILYDYDGYRTPESLMGLIDEVRGRLLTLLDSKP